MQRIYLLSLFLFSFYLSFGQIDNGYIRLNVFPEDVRPCDTSYIEVEVLYKATELKFLTVQFNLPKGVTYIENSFEFLNNPDGYSGNSPSFSANSPIFQIIPTGGSTAKLGDVIRFRFAKRVGCDAIDELNKGVIFKDVQILDITQGINVLHFENANPNVSNYDVLIPALVVQSINNLDVNVGQTVNRDVTVVQSGEGQLKWYQHKVTLGAGVGNYVLSYNGTNLTPDSISGNELFYNIYLENAPFVGQVGDGDNLWENGETIVFQETFQVQECEGDAIGHQGIWGCSLSELCQSSIMEYGYLNFKGAAPELTIKKFAGDDYMDLCGGQNFTVRVENIATNPGSMAKDINTNLGLGHNSSPLSDYNKNPFWDFDWRGTRNLSNVRINGFPVATSNWPSTIYPSRGSGNSIQIPYDYFVTDPDGPGGLEDIDGDGYYDDLAPGEHIDISFDYSFTPRANCGEKRYDYLTWEHLYIDVLCKDQCANERYTERINFEYSNIVRDYLNETVTSSPNGVSDGDNFAVGIKPHFYKGGWVTLKQPRCNGEDLFTGSGVTWTVEITVPNGVSLQASAPASFSQSGNVITYTQNSYQYKMYDFPLTFDCGVYTGGELLNISYKTHYSCSCWDEDIHCGNITLQSLCPTVCKGPKIINFDANRTVAGWVDDTKTNRVTLDNSFELNNYMAFDTIEVVALGVIEDSSVQNLYFEIAYETETNGGDEDLFSFVDGVIEIEDLYSGVFSTPLTVAPVKTVVGPNSYKLTFDLSSYQSIVSGTYNYGEGNENDSIELKMNLVLSDDFKYRKYFELKKYTATFFAKDGATETGCNLLYEKMTYLKPDRAISNYSEIKTWYCTPTEQRLFFHVFSDVGNIFPNEFRNPIEWDSTVIVMPKGVKFSGDVAYFNYTTTYNPSYTVANGGITFNIYGDSLVLYPGPNFKNVNQRGTGYPRFRPKFIGTCEAEKDIPYSYTVFYKEFAYVKPTPKSKTANPTFQYFRPQFELQSPHPEVTVVSNEPYVDVQICNTSPVAIDYNWLQIENNPNFSVTKAFILDGAGNEVLLTNFSTSGGKTWVESGAVSASGCQVVRVYGNITGCGDQTITVSNGWDCLSYPTDYDGLDPMCYQKTIDLKLSVQDAQVQVAISAEPDSIVYCESFNLSLEVNSAQVANLLNPYLLVDIPGDVGNMPVDSVVVEYPKNSGIIETVPSAIVGDKLRINLSDHSGIAPEGMLGSYVESQEELRKAVVDIYMSLNCAFLNLSAIQVLAFGESPCGVPAVSSGVTVTSEDIVVKGANTPYYAYTEFKLKDSINYCNTTQTIDVKSTVIAGTTGVVDSVDISIPIGLSFVNGSFGCIGTNCATYEYTYSSGGQDHIVIAFPHGVGNKDSIEYQFDVVSGNSYCSDMEYFDVESYIYSTGGVCGAAECAPTKIVTGAQTDSLVIAKPDLVVLNNTVATSMVTSLGDTKYGVNLNIENIGIDAVNGYDYTIYCADASGNPSTEIYSNSFSDVLQTGDTLAQIFYFYASTACDPANGLVFEIAPTNSNCLCDVVRYLVPLTPGMDANDDTYTTPEDTQLTNNVSINDTPKLGVTYHTTPITNVTHGTLTLNVDGSFTYMPDLDYFGSDSFVYEVCDSGDPVQCDTATVIITITPVTDPPIAIDDNYTTPEDTPLSGDVSTNDSDPDGGLLTFNTLPLVDVTNGALTLNADGTFNYIPDLNYVGLDSFEYQVCNDGSPSMCDTAMVYITVTPINDKPIAIDDNYTTPEDILLSGNVTDNDTDVEGGLNVNPSPISGVSHGTLTLNSDGTFTYMPDLNYFGPDEFTYQVCDLGTPALCDTATVYITVTPVNDKPIAVDDNYTTPEDTPFSDNVMDNDSDVEGGLTVTTIPVFDVVNGTLVLNSDGTFTYLPDLNYVGLDSFSYVICDGGMPVLCDTATVYITVSPVNDKPIAVDDNYTTPEETLLSGNVTDNDTDVEGGLNVNPSPILGVSHGTLTLNSDGTFTYLPDLNYFGPDEFTYQVCDLGTPALCDTATVYITVTPLNDKPIAVDDNYTTPEDTPFSDNVMDNDSDVEGGLTVTTIPVFDVVNGTLVLNSDGTFTYSPDLNYEGLDSFSYVICDGGMPVLCDTATVYITVSPVNDKPIAVDDNYTTAEETLLSGNVTDNDTDVEGGMNVNPSPILGVSHGTLTLNSDGTFTYLPDLNYVGPDEFTYQVCDLGTPALCDTATVYITVTPVNDPPIAIDDSYYTDTNMPITSENVLDNDNDIDGDGLTVNTTPLNGPLYGTLVLNSDGTFVYNPGFNFNGYDQFDYVVCDLGTPTLCDTATVFIKIGNVEVLIDQPDTLDCATSLVTIDGSNSSQGVGFTYTWTTTNGHIVSGENTWAAVVDLPGDYTLSILDTVSNITAVASVEVTIDTLAPTGFIMTPDKITCVANSIFLSGVGSDTGSNYSYQWSTANGNLSGATNNILAEATQVGDYQLEVVNSLNGCSSTTTTTVSYDTISPIASITTPTQEITCTDLCMQLDASGTSSGSLYAWTTVNGYIQSGGNTLSPTVCAGGQYDLLVTDISNGCTSSAQTTVIDNSSLPSISMISNQKITCDIKQVYIEATVNTGSGNYEYSWSPAASIVSGSNLSNPLVSQPTTYTVTVTDNATGCTNTQSVLVESGVDYPQVSLIAQDTITCKDSIVTVNATFNSTYNVVWSTTEGTIVSGGQTPNLQVSAPGTYQAIVTNPANGCESTSYVDVATDINAPIADANEAQKQDCNTTLVQLGNLDNAQLSNVHFTWTTTDGNFVSSENLPNPIVDQVGTYTMVVTDMGTGCTTEDEVEVVSVAPLSGADFIVSLPGCNGTQGAIIVDQVIGSSEPFIYSFDDGQHFGTAPIVAGLLPGDYDIVIQDDLGCEYSETINVPVPEAGDILVGEDVTITLGDSTLVEVFSSTPADAIDTILWDPAANLTCFDNCFEQMVDPLVTTVYNVTIIDTLGCVSRAKSTVHVADPDIFIPNAFSPNSADGQNDKFTVMGNSSRVVEIESMDIYNRWGNQVFTRKNFPLNDYSSGWDGTFNGKPAQEGVYVYLIKVRYVDGRVVPFEGDISIFK